uniref:Uncharacterized protein n=1 Tax=Gasterosteus aculeatus TaxID=69293 RepID=G3NUE4_GASAC
MRTLVDAFLYNCNISGDHLPPSSGLSSACQSSPATFPAAVQSSAVWRSMSTTTTPFTDTCAAPAVAPCRAPGSSTFTSRSGTTLSSLSSPRGKTCTSVWWKAVDRSSELANTGRTTWLEFTNIPQTSDLIKLRRTEEPSRQRGSSRKTQPWRSWTRCARERLIHPSKENPWRRMCVRKKLLEWQRLPLVRSTPMFRLQIPARRVQAPSHRKPDSPTGFPQQCALVTAPSEASEGGGEEGNEPQLSFHLFLHQ